MKEQDDRSRRRFLKESSMLGLAVALSPVTIAEAFANSKSKLIQRRTSWPEPLLHNSAASR